MIYPRLLNTSDDVTAEVLQAAEDGLDGWFADSVRIDWEDFIDRLSDYGNSAEPSFDFDSYDSPAVRKIQRHVRELRRAS